MSLIMDTSSSKNYRLHSPKCKHSQSVRKWSFFEDLKLTILQILSVIFCCAAKVAVKSAAAITGIRSRSLSQWYQYMREKSSESLINSPNYTFGGVRVIVQIDESVVAKRKYNVGHYVEQQWVLGLYDTATKLGHIKLVDDRWAEML